MCFLPYYYYHYLYLTFCYYHCYSDMYNEFKQNYYLRDSVDKSSNWPLLFLCIEIWQSIWACHTRGSQSQFADAGDGSKEYLTTIEENAHYIWQPRKRLWLMETTQTNSAIYCRLFIKDKLRVLLILIDSILNTVNIKQQTNQRLKISLLVFSRERGVGVEK